MPHATKLQQFPFKKMVGPITKLSQHLVYVCEVGFEPTSLPKGTGFTDQSYTAIVAAHTLYLSNFEYRVIECLLHSDDGIRYEIILSKIHT